MSDNYTPQNPQPQPPNGGRGGPAMSDPTVLTTEALTRQITNLKELLVEKIDGADKLSKAKFDNIETQFEAIEAWRKEQKLDTKTAVDAALQAAEKAVREQTVASEKAITKSETSSTEQSKQQFATFSANLNGLSTIVDDVKERVLRIESRSEGVSETKAITRGDTNTLISVFGAIAIAASIAVAIVSLVTR